MEFSYFGNCNLYLACRRSYKSTAGLALSSYGGDNDNPEMFATVSQVFRQLFDACRLDMSILLLT